MRTHNYDSFTIQEVKRLDRKYRRRQLLVETAKWVGLAVVFGLVGAMLAYRG